MIRFQVDIGDGLQNASEIGSWADQRDIRKGTHYMHIVMQDMFVDTEALSNAGSGRMAARPG